MDLNLGKKLMKWYIWNTAVHDTGSWTLQKIDQKYLRSIEM